MGYYRGAGDCMYGKGDYYRGDYYQGDFLGLGKVFKAFGHALGPLTDLIPGGAAIKILAKGAGALMHPSAAPGPSFAVPPGNALVPFAPQMQLQQQTGFMNVGVQEMGMGGGGAAQGGQVVHVPGVGLCLLPSGRRGHMNKSTYITRGGGTSHWPQQLMVHPKGTECVKVRRMNVANPRALRRSLRRLQGFSKLARRVMTFTHPKAGKGHFKFRRKR